MNLRAFQVLLVLSAKQGLPVPKGAVVLLAEPGDPQSQQTGGSGVRQNSLHGATLPATGQGP